MNAPRHGHTDRGGGGALFIGCAAFAVLLLALSLGGAFFFLRTGPSGIPPLVLTPPPAPVVPASAVPATPSVPAPPSVAVPEPLPAGNEGTIGLASLGTIEPDYDPDDPARVTGRVVAGSHEVSGSLDPDAIRRVVRRHINEVRYCYERALAEDPALSGRLTVSFVISPTGSVSVASAGDGTFPDTSTTTTMTACVVSAVRRWTFPAPDGGIVTVDYPFVLNPD